MIISCDGVTKTFGQATVLKNISFSIEKGQIFGVVGPSGCGKTTLLKMLVGFLSPTQGTISLHEPYQPKQSIGFTTQNNCFYDELTVKENMNYFGKIYGISSKELKRKRETLLSFVGLQTFQDKLGSELSGGMSRRLDMAIALLNDPPIIIFDELTAGLDLKARRQFVKKIRQLKETGRTIIMSTHMLEEVDELCDNMVILKDGEVLAQGHPKKIKQEIIQSEQIIVQSSPGKYEALVKTMASYTKIIDYRIEDEKLILFCEKASASLHALLYALQHHNEELLEVDVSKPDMNSVFERVT